MECKICGSNWHKTEQCPKNDNQASLQDGDNIEEPVKIDGVSFETARQHGLRFYWRDNNGIYHRYDRVTE